MSNLMEELQNELSRNRELLAQYRAIGPAGMFGAAAIQSDISAAESAIASNDVVEMARVFKRLVSNE